MPSDPVSRRRGEAPQHPRGFPAADDAPVHVGDTLDVRAEVAQARAAREERASLLPGDRGSMIPASAIVELGARTSVPPDIGAQGVRFDMAFPAEERMVGGTPLREPIVPPPDRPDDDYGAAPRVRAPSTSAMRAVVAPIVESGAAPVSPSAENQAPPDSKPPSTTPFERPRASHFPSGPHDADARADASERDALIRDLAAIGGLDERADRDVDRSPSARATLARARALRFRLSLHDVWPPHAKTDELLSEEVGRVRAVVPRPVHVDLAIECALLVAIADGAPYKHPLLAAERDRAVMRAVVRFLLAHRPELPRVSLRDRGTATIARLTIVGWAGAMASLARTAVPVPIDARLAALELSARVAVTPAIDEHRVGALADLERALSLPAGVAAAALASEHRSPGGV